MYAGGYSVTRGRYAMVAIAIARVAMIARNIRAQRERGRAIPGR